GCQRPRRATGANSIRRGHSLVPGRGADPPGADIHLRSHRLCGPHAAEMKQAASSLFLAVFTPSAAHGAGADWSIYGGGPEGNRYSTLTQIDKTNVARLQPAWTFRMDAAGDPQTHPLAIDGIVYAYTPTLQVIALDGANGKLLWQFDSGVDGRGAQRGMTWW